MSEKEELIEIKKLFSEFRFKEIIARVISMKSPKPEFLHYKADSLFELGDFDQARQIYSELGLDTNIGFCYLMQSNFEKAQESYLKAEASAAKKWGLFLILLLSRVEKVFPGPGYLTFRLFFEATYGYFLRFKKQEYLELFSELLPQLKAMYPDIEKEMEKAQKLLKSS